VTYDVVVDVDNEDQILLPGMTAYINIIVNRRKDVLLIPNAALRFRPSSDEVPGNAERARREPGKKRDAGETTVYVLEGDKIKPAKIKIGITDNRSTEVVEGDLKPGDLVITADMRGQQNKPAGGGNNPPRIRMF
jgi:HlyD family secretion protein